MRPIGDSRQRWKTLFHHNNTPSDLRRALKSEQGANICNDGLRSICWKAFLLFDDLSYTQWLDKISESRSTYIALKDHFMKYIEHPDDLQSNIDPLADDEQSPWQTLRQDEQMRADISQDVDRCLQDNFFFREPATKAKMIDILFIYSKLNPDLGYRQGMHELLAPILWIVDRDAIDPKSVDQTSLTGQDDLMLELLNSDYIEHDAFSLFCSVMQNSRVYYEHNSHRSANGQTDAIPIVLQCQHIHNDLLGTTDLELADHLQALDVLPQIYLTRWMRLLFGREFPFQDVLDIWDLIFAEGLRSDLIDCVCVAMLLRVRWQLLSADSSTALTMLLRYPSPHPHPPSSLVHDGLYLEQNPTPERGAFIISKYSGRPPESPKLPESAGGKSRPAGKFQFRSDFRNRSETRSPSRSPATSSPLSIEALLQDVSEGIQRRTETWGVAKAVRGAVGEAKKNMQAIQSEHNQRIVRYGDATAVRAADSSLRRDAEAAAQLKAKIESIEERNRMLARSLSEAVSDIRSHMSKDETSDAKIKDAMKEALVKIESVQTCLENPATSLDGACRPSNADDSADDSKQPNNSITTDRNSAAMEDNRPACSSRGSSATKKSGPKSPVKSDRGKGTELPSKQVPNPMPLRHPTRPSLANSEFSWMLGDSRHLSSFIDPISVPPEQTRQSDMRAKHGALFGNEDGEQKKSQAESDGMALKSLRGAKGRE